MLACLFLFFQFPKRQADDRIRNEPRAHLLRDALKRTRILPDAHAHLSAGVLWRRIQRRRVTRIQVHVPSPLAETDEGCAMVCLLMRDDLAVLKGFPSNLNGCPVRLFLQKLKHSGARETVFLLSKRLRRAHEPFLAKILRLPQGFREAHRHAIFFGERGL